MAVRGWRKGVAERGKRGGGGQNPLGVFPCTTRAGTRYAMDRRLLSIVPHCVHVFPVIRSPLISHIPLPLSSHHQ